MLRFVDTLFVIRSTSFAFFQQYSLRLSVVDMSTMGCSRIVFPAADLVPVSDHRFITRYEITSQFLGSRIKMLAQKAVI